MDVRIGLHGESRLFHSLRKYLNRPPLTVRIPNDTHINDLDNFTAFIVLSHITIGTILHPVETRADGAHAPC